MVLVRLGHFLNYLQIMKKRSHVAGSLSIDHTPTSQISDEVDQKVFHKFECSGSRNSCGICICYNKIMLNALKNIRKYAFLEYLRRFQFLSIKKLRTFVANQCKHNLYLWLFVWEINPNAERKFYQFSQLKIERWKLQENLESKYKKSKVPHILCRICERKKIPADELERHTELCLLRHNVGKNMRDIDDKLLRCGETITKSLKRFTTKQGVKRREIANLLVDHSRTPSCISHNHPPRHLTYTKDSLFKLGQIALGNQKEKGDQDKANIGCERKLYNKFEFRVEDEDRIPSVTPEKQLAATRKSLYEEAVSSSGVINTNMNMDVNIPSVPKIMISEPVLSSEEGEKKHIDINKKVDEQRELMIFNFAKKRTPPMPTPKKLSKFGANSRSNTNESIRTTSSPLMLKKDPGRKNMKQGIAFLSQFARPNLSPGSTFVNREDRIDHGTDHGSDHRPSPRELVPSPTNQNIHKSPIPSLRVPTSVFIEEMKAHLKPPRSPKKMNLFNPSKIGFTPLQVGKTPIARAKKMNRILLMKELMNPDGGKGEGSLPGSIKKELLNSIREENKGNIAKSVFSQLRPRAIDTGGGGGGGGVDHPGPPSAGALNNTSFLSPLKGVGRNSSLKELSRGEGKLFITPPSKEDEGKDSRDPNSILLSKLRMRVHSKRSDESHNNSRNSVNSSTQPLCSTVSADNSIEKDIIKDFSLNPTSVDIHVIPEVKESGEIENFLFPSKGKSRPLDGETPPLMGERKLERSNISKDLAVSSPAGMMRKLPSREKTNMKAPSPFNMYLPRSKPGIGDKAQEVECKPELENKIYHTKGDSFDDVMELTDSLKEMLEKNIEGKSRGKMNTQKRHTVYSIPTSSLKHTKSGPIVPKLNLRDGIDIMTHNKSHRRKTIKPSGQMIENSQESENESLISSEKEVIVLEKFREISRHAFGINISLNKATLTEIDILLNQLTELESKANNATEQTVKQYKELEKCLLEKKEIVSKLLELEEKMSNIGGSSDNIFGGSDISRIENRLYISKASPPSSKKTSTSRLMGKVSSHGSGEVPEEFIDSSFYSDFYSAETINDDATFVFNPDDVESSSSPVSESKMTYHSTGHGVEASNLLKHVLIKSAAKKIIGGLHGQTTPSSSTPTPPSDKFTFTSEESQESKLNASPGEEGKTSVEGDIPKKSSPNRKKSIGVNFARRNSLRIATINQLILEDITEDKSPSPKSSKSGTPGISRRSSLKLPTVEEEIRTSVTSADSSINTVPKSPAIVIRPSHLRSHSAEGAILPVSKASDKNLHRSHSVIVEILTDEFEMDGIELWLNQSCLADYKQKPYDEYLDHLEIKINRKTLRRTQSVIIYIYIIFRTMKSQGELKMFGEVRRQRTGKVQEKQSKL